RSPQSLRKQKNKSKQEMFKTEVVQARRTPDAEYPECKAVWECLRNKGLTDEEILVFLDSCY
ncbi:MAG: hypothetical protein RSB53_07370, partial [Oscillospiraceae bacterium]